MIHIWKASRVTRVPTCEEVLRLLAQWITAFSHGKASPIPPLPHLYQVFFGRSELFVFKNGVRRQVVPLRATDFEGIKHIFGAVTSGITCRGNGSGDIHAEVVLVGSDEESHGA